MRRGSEAEPLERRMLLADTVGLLQGMNDAASGPTPAPSHEEFGDMIATSSGKVFFTADRSPVGRELWVTDGTQAGTHLVKDIFFGPGSSSPTSLRDVNGTLFFVARDSLHGFELWKSDGTEAGTVMVKDIVPGGAGLDYPVPQSEPLLIQSAALGNLYVFTNGWGDELWRSDGTEAGTYRLKQVPPRDASGIRQSFWSLSASHGSVYFLAPDAEIGREMWKTDGTVAGTTLVTDLLPGPENGDPIWFAPGAGGLTYFSATSDWNPLTYSVYRTDGTAAGTSMVLEGSRMLDTRAFQGKTYFVRMPYTGQSVEVWSSDGTLAGTQKVVAFEVDPSDPGSGYGPVKILGEFKGKLLLYGYTAATGAEYWLSDGTQAGTKPLMENPGPSYTLLAAPRVVGDSLYFFKTTPQTGYEPYKSDGTPEGTVLLKDVVPGPVGSGWFQTKFLPTSSGNVVFPAQSAEPQVVIIPGPIPSRATYYFADLFATDGTPEGTEKLETVVPPPSGSVVGRHVFYNNSSFDGNADGNADTAAIAPDKQALLPGQSASFVNVTSYSKGINGIMVDVRGLSPDAALTADDFVIRSGAGPSASNLSAESSHLAVGVWRGKGDGGSDRVTLVWPDGAIKNKWVQVTVKANDRTGLATPDVFYFGNLVGETGDALTPTRVSAADLVGIKRVLNTRVGADSPYDINRDGNVNALDLGIVRAGLFQQLAPIAVPIPVSTAPSAAAGGTATSLLRDA